MHVLVTGAGGFIGSHLVQALLHAGHRVTACVRNTSVAQQRWPDINLVKVDYTGTHGVDHWLPYLQDIDVVINAVGIIRESGKQRFAALHTRAPCTLFCACQKARVKRVIQISALGADDTAFSQYHLSKRAADVYLMSLDLDWAIVMPSIVYGPGANSMAFFTALAALPVIPLIDTGNQPVQPIHIDDVTKALLQLITANAQQRIRMEMVGPRPVTMREILGQLRHWLHLGTPRFLQLPFSFVLLSVRSLGMFGNLPLSAEAVQMLRQGNTGDVTVFVNRFGFEPVGFDASLKNTPAQQADIWHAGLYFSRPLLRFCIALLWISTAIVSAFVFPVDQSYSMLAKAGVSGIFAPITLYAAATMDLLLGIATLLRYRIGLVGCMQIVIMLLYTVIITCSQAEYWLHPFGPLTKNIPLVIATLIMMVLERKS